MPNRQFHPPTDLTARAIAAGSETVVAGGAVAAISAGHALGRAVHAIRAHSRGPGRAQATCAMYDCKWDAHHALNYLHVTV